MDENMELADLEIIEKEENEVVEPTSNKNKMILGAGVAAVSALATAYIMKKLKQRKSGNDEAKIKKAIEVLEKEGYNVEPPVELKEEVEIED